MGIISLTVDHQSDLRVKGTTYIHTHKKKSHSTFIVWKSQNSCVSNRSWSYITSLPIHLQESKEWLTSASCFWLLHSTLCYVASRINWSVAMHSELTISVQYCTVATFLHITDKQNTYSKHINFFNKTYHKIKLHNMAQPTLACRGIEYQHVRRLLMCRCD